MSEESKGPRPLREIEMEVEAEGRDWTRQRLQQRLQEEALQRPPVEREPQRAPTKLRVLMIDGWQVRQPGRGWGKKKTQEPRVEWHEWKIGFIRWRHCAMNDRLQLLRLSSIIFKCRSATAAHALLLL